MAKSKVFTGIAVALAVLVGAASYALRTKHSSPGAVVVRFEALPLAFEAYQGEERWFDEGTYTVLRADTSTLRYYVDDLGFPLFLFVAYFGEQTYGEQIHSPRNCLPGGGWTIRSLDRVPIEIPGRRPVVSNRMLIEYEGRREVMYYFFLTRVGSVASEYRLKLMLAQSALTFQPRDAVFVRVTAPVGTDGAEAADRRVTRFLSQSMALLSAGLPFQ